MGNSYGFKIPRDEVAHSLPLAAVADIAEPALLRSGEHDSVLEFPAERSGFRFSKRASVGVQIR